MVHTFPKGICPKVKIIARLEYELAYYDSAVHRFNHDATRTPPYHLMYLVYFPQLKLVINQDVWVVILCGKDNYHLTGCDRFRRNGWAVRYRPNIKLGGFRSQFEASNVSSHTEELWYNKRVCLWMTLKARIKGKVKQSRELNSALPNTSV